MEVRQCSTAVSHQSNPTGTAELDTRGLETPKVTQDLNDGPAAVEFDDATVTTESTPLYPMTDIAPRMLPICPL